jgi:NAD-dependent deacetylase
LNYVPAGVPVYLIDPNDVRVTRRDVVVIRKGASEGMRFLLDENLNNL